VICKERQRLALIKRTNEANECDKDWLLVERRWLTVKVKVEANAVDEDVEEKRRW